MRKEQIAVDVPDGCEVGGVHQSSRCGGPEHDFDYFDVRVHLTMHEPLAIKACRKFIADRERTGRTHEAYQLAKQAIAATRAECASELYGMADSDVASVTDAPKALRMAARYITNEAADRIDKE